MHSFLYYGVVAWTLNSEIIRRLNSFKMWTYRRILRISLVDQIANDEELKRIRKQKEVKIIIK